MVTLEEVKTHLNIDTDYTADDTYLNWLIEVANESILNQLDWTETEEVEYPKAVNHAILMRIAELYNNREETTSNSVNQRTKAADFLVSQHRRYTIA